MTPSQSPAATGNTLDKQLDDILATFITNIFTSSDVRASIIYGAKAKQAILDLFNATVTASKPEKQATLGLKTVARGFLTEYDKGYNDAIDTFETALRAAIGGNNKEGEL